jgi:hypothetical protein
MFHYFPDCQFQQFRDFLLAQQHLFLEHQLLIGEQELPKFLER